MDSSVRQKLAQLTNKCQVLSKNGKYPQCIDIMEQIVSIKKDVYGMDHPQFQKSAQKLCEYLNLAAMLHLQKQKFDQSLDCLRKAELVCRNSPQFKSTTYNNLACYYRRTGKIRTALTYLIQALQLQLKLQQPKTLADTHLNLCAVLSQLDRHQDALQHVMLSIILLQDQFLGITMPYYFNRHSQQYNQQQNPPAPQINDERLAVLSIAYHNLGVQFQHLKRFQEAVKIYKKALQLSKDYLSDNQQLIQNLAKVVNSATEQIEDQKKVHHEGKKQKYQRQMSENKRQLYKQLAKNSQKMKNLPKLKINKQPPVISLQSSSNDPLNKTSYDKKYGQQQHNNEKQRNFATRKHPRYYKSHAVTPSDDQSQSRQSYGLSFDHSRID